MTIFYKKYHFPPSQKMSSISPSRIYIKPDVALGWGLADSIWGRWNRVKNKKKYLIKIFSSVLNLKKVKGWIFYDGQHIRQKAPSERQAARVFCSVLDCHRTCCAPSLHSSTQLRDHLPFSSSPLEHNINMSFLLIIFPSCSSHFSYREGNQAMVSYVVSFLQPNRIESNQISYGWQAHRGFPIFRFVSIYVYHYSTKKIRVNHFPFFIFLSLRFQHQLKIW